MSENSPIQKPKRNAVGFIIALLSILLFIFFVYLGSRKAVWITAYESHKKFVDGKVNFEFNLAPGEKYKIFMVSYTYARNHYYYVLGSKLTYPTGKTINIEKYFTPQMENNKKPHLVADSRMLFNVKGEEGLFNLNVELKEMKNNAKIDSVKLVIKK